ncbi:riboflavin synthase [Flavobacteriaceae bacterium F89]|uniref:Riboflavin synthase n=1 Tax=Cerina litoralis TaxID=2874477 RepID=A0AAE3ERY1_9FLAO|nr:riboflavin synthase [Cerina litoralis]MCG2459295.1 riboflavin synthase [Cerina litoralis]
MFTGIIETLGQVKNLETEGGNLHITLSSSFSTALKIDQSVAHNGVCLTVVAIDGSHYTVTAVAETLLKTNLGKLQQGDLVNLERAMILGSRLDGHIVQGHVDGTGTCIGLEENDGSWVFTFEYEPNLGLVTIEKGSITIDGVSLTVVNSGDHSFSVAIIPYTFENTCFKTYKVGTQVNLEFDVIGKYVARLMKGPLS